MDGMLDPQDPRLSQAWDILKAQSPSGETLSPESNRLAFADPEFLLRRETRGIRFQLEMLKPDLAQQEHGIEHTVVVFGSARFQSQEKAQKTLEVAQASGLVADINKHNPNKLFICTGGGPGIMEAANRGASEAGGISVGLNIALPHEQTPNPYITPELSFKFHYFALRKMHFMMRAKALVAFPGGFGTMDELFETLTLVQCKKAKPVPIVLFGTDYWKKVFHPEMMLEEGVIAEEDLQLFRFVDSVEDAWEVIRAFYAL
ncbi:MAG: TIGR00730 family Rossman fold protein [Betaproteobacteria bacterium]|nr:TIGR00730 family Rossman fold protein [Betaproteobacteria bacterium]